MQRPPVSLPIAEPRCRPEAHVCARREFCARALVPAAIGRPLADFSAPAGSYSCSRWMDAAAHRAEPVKAGPRVHEPVRGLS